ncbi:DUF3396 domain-containing protein [Burkholderia multivorans]|uniref:DUF3396 domain-containing protein n=1 Tax=Burkholderia multivorans TaxID=87883 RepID=UPI000D00B06A|nr:DUF3396 domain-containing protein [Burkholderia multivorans]MBU9403475.1 DUF3396 domain-containing protein [Burkholderia multivorans]MDN8050531.1 DUF3396 domain-containing protein [Burkholderia multivorans]PRH20389.1 hypothetical protein C6T71_22025 [Burkholderia multivorans]
MTNDEIAAWAKDPRRADTMPFGLYEPAHQKGITGAALVVRGVLYFRDGFTPAVRQALVRCFTQYNAAIEEYNQALQVRAGEQPSKSGPLRWLYAEGEEPAPYEKAPGFESIAARVPADETLAVAMTSAEHKLATGFYEFTVFALSEGKAARKRGLDGLAFTVPRAFLLQRPGVFETLFNAFAKDLPTVHGHGGLAVNVPPMGRRPNEASEYFYARRFGPGIDVGDPMRSTIRKLYTKIKTVDWLNALDGDLVRAVGGSSSLMLPPDWFSRQPLGNGGLLIKAGVAPESGVSNGPGIPVSPPAAYVILNRALKPIIADSVDTLQDGTLDSTAPLLNTVVATEGWLRRFDVSDDQLNAYWVELHKTPKLHNDA